ncbi:ATP-binding protein, partial [Streptomyces tricolor]|uniref:ATP-binding protein n=1 Tax=Streptomyces tricolor TaxID=68277 RepID=UPI0039E1BEF3
MPRGPSGRRPLTAAPAGRPPRRRPTGGSGLGLSIVRHLVAAQGATAGAASEPGAGAVFTLRLPAVPPPG